ncbi:hypothetical protein B6V74_18280 [Thioclava sp. F42-5]|uniref:PAS domain-containing sensor histidine kinase n=1 Tax=Thioclava sp. F42-5 TaxID=1973005 RepID=UPI000B5414C6|nr:PAS domain-containing sensor histidine kinase [Thioclava sp. F42-5]OWY07363.1 hypothetical protein B6V74_18280 [Thioclava sp. F42-5]
MARSNLALLETHPWHETSLGPVEDWPPEMRGVIAAIMASDFPVCTGWGDDTIQIYNDAYNAIFGDKHPASFGAPLRDTWPEIWPFVRDNLGHVKRSGEPLLFQDTMLPLAKTGRPEECYFDFSYSAIKDLGGRVLGVMSIAVETTDAVVARRRQAMSEITATSHAGGGVPAFSGALHAVLSDNYMDCRAGILFRLSPENGMPLEAEWTIRADPQFTGALRPVVAAALSGKSERIFNLPRDAQRPELSDRGIVIPIADGRAQLIAALVLVPHALVPIDRSLAPFATQLSQRVHASLHSAELLEQDLVRAREQMTEQSAMYQFLFENIRDGAIYTATTGRPEDDEFVLALNTRACEMLGYDAEEAIGMHRDAFFFPEDRDLALALQERNRNDVFVGDLTFRAKDGSPVPVEVTSNIVELTKGERRSVTIIRDLANRTSRDRERDERMRTEALASLTRAVAHDFNNLLTVVLGSLDALEEGLPEQDSNLNLVQSAVRAAEEAGRLTSQLLAYSRRTPTKLRMLQIGAFVQEIRPLLIAALGDANRLDIDIGEDVANCWADTSALTSALINLVTNARHAMTGDGTLSITANVVSGTGFYPSHDGYELPQEEYVAVNVRDNGPGVPASHREKIFEPFFTTKGIGEGTGLGLPTVLDTVRQIGGDLRLGPGDDDGAEFQILLPLATEADGKEAEAAAPAGNDEVVLYVEDNLLVREKTVLMLQNLGFSPLVARHGREALDYARSDRRIDIVLTDLVMPGLSGRALVRELARLRPALPVVIVTGYDPEDPASGMEMASVLMKPYSREELADALVRNLPSPRTE